MEEINCPKCGNKLIKEKAYLGDDGFVPEFMYCKNCKIHFRNNKLKNKSN